MTSFLLDASVILAALDPDDLRFEASCALLFDEPHDLATIDLARYEVANVAIAGWREPHNAPRALAVVETLGGRDGLVRSDVSLIAAASEIAAKYAISVYDATYVAASEQSSRRLVSCDERDLVANGLAILPADAI